MDIRARLSKRNEGVEWSGIRVMFARCEQIEGVVNLGIGQPDFDTPPHVIEAAGAALAEGFTRYPPAKGFGDLREAIARKLRRENGIVADPDREIFVAVGAMQGIFNTALHLLEPGDEVLVADPGYDYYSQIRLFGGVPVRIPVREENGFALDPDDVRAAVTERTKLIVLNSPSNPTGAVLDREALEEIAKIAREREIFVLSDEPYESILFDGAEHVSIGSFEGMKDLTISVYTLSKTYAMTGWRVGYVVAHPAIIDEMEKLMEHQVSGVTAVAQRAALAAIEGPQECVEQMRRAYERRRAIVHEGLNAIEGVSCLLPRATFYAFPNVSALGMSSWDLAMELVTEHRVATVPGSIFGDHGEGYLRVSFAADEASLRQGVNRIREGVEAVRARAG